MCNANQIDIKSWLWRYRNAKINVYRLQGEYDELLSIQESISAVTYDGMPHGTGENSADLSNLMITRDNAISKLVQAKHRMAVAYTEITDAISQLDSDLKQSIISLRYVQLKSDYEPNTLYDIADLTNYSHSYICTIHGKALEDLRVIVAESRKKVIKSNKK